MKKIFLPLAVLLTTTINAQVGINTDNPKATLDISANPDGTIAVPSGLLIPRITRAIAQNTVPIPQESTLVYVNELSGTQTGAAIDINTIGFYYFKENKWNKLITGAFSGGDPIPYNFTNGLSESNGNVKLGGTLTDTNTTINTQGRNFNIIGLPSGSTSNNLVTVDNTTGTLKTLNLGTINNGTTYNFTNGLTETNGTAKLGGTLSDNSIINTDSNNLQIGNIYFNRNNNALEVIGKLKIADGTEGNNKILTSDGTGIARWADLQDKSYNFTNGLTLNNGTVKLGGELSDANTEIITTATNTLAIKNLQPAYANEENIVMVDNNGVLKLTNNIISDLRIPEPAVLELKTTISQFLSTSPVNTLYDKLPLKQVMNSIEELTINDSSAEETILTFQPGIYQMTLSYEADYYPAPEDCTTSSYFIQFPTGSNSIETAYTNAVHSPGYNSNHGGTVSFTSVLTSPTTWKTNLSLGNAGNCTRTVNGNIVSAANHQLKAPSTQLVILRLGNVPN